MANKYSILDLFDVQHSDLLEICKNHGFDIKNDFKHLRQFKIAEQYKIMINSIPYEYELQKGKNVVYRSGSVTIEKLRFKDEYRKASKGSGFRMVCIFDLLEDHVTIIPVHIYMHNGAQGKSDLSDYEKKECRKLVEYLVS